MFENSGQVIGIISAGGVQLHGAGAERDHRAVERQIRSDSCACSAAFRFGAVHVEDRMGQVFAGARSASGRRVARLEVGDLKSPPKCAKTAPSVAGAAWWLVERDADRASRRPCAG
jgi:hypothetical protein